MAHGPAASLLPGRSAAILSDSSSFEVPRGVGRCRAAEPRGTVEDERAGGSPDTGWGAPIQRLHLLADRCFTEGLSAQDVATYDALTAEVARTCGTTSGAVARLLLRRELARRAEDHGALDQRFCVGGGVLVCRPPAGADDHPVDPGRSLTFLHLLED